MSDRHARAVEVNCVTRVFQRRKHEPRVALDQLDLAIEPGEVHGLLGPNGAGKTTLCRILSTVLLPTGGMARIEGHDVVREAATVRRLIGIVFGGERGLYARLTARQNLRYWSALYLQPTREGHKRVEGLLERVGLADRAYERVETFSRGMKQRLHLARGLIGDPRVLLLDEPTTGLDPVAAHEFRQLIEELRAERRTVLLTTHDMAEAESVCDRVSLIDNGRLLATEDPRTIGSWFSAQDRITAGGVPVALVSSLRGMSGVAAVEHDPERGTVTVETNAPGATNLVLRALVEAGIDDVATSKPDLEAVYLHLIGKRGLAV